MSEIINQYETIFVVDAALEEETIAGIVDKFKTLIGEAGEIESVDEWGKRRLAYPIDYKTEGYYVLINFSAKPDFPLELERIYNITDGLLRSITVKMCIRDRIWRCCARGYHGGLFHGTVWWLSCGKYIRNWIV